MSANWFLATMYLIWILESQLIRSNNQSKVTLWVLETCLIVGLLPFMIILITASLSSKIFNNASLREECTFEERKSTLSRSSVFRWIFFRVGDLCGSPILDYSDTLLRLFFEFFLHRINVSFLSIQILCHPHTQIRTILVHDVQRDIFNLEFSPSHVSIRFSQIAFPLIVLPKGDRTNSAQEEQLGLPYWTWFWPFVSW